MTDIGLVYTGKVIDMEAIDGADFIACATVICGEGGKWKGVIRKSECYIGLLVTVYMPDALITEQHAKDYGMDFMKSSHYRVKMRRFKDAPSEVVIMPKQTETDLGFDCTEMLGVTKYHKPIPANMHGKAKGDFPSFIPKTDEPNYQNSVGQEYIEQLVGKPYFITEKADGSSTTAFKYNGQFGVCSRNWELERDEKNGYWEIAIRHKLEENMPEGFALQWETCGPKIQSNPHGFHEVTGLAFSAYNILESRYLDFDEFIKFCVTLQFPVVPLIHMDNSFSVENIDTLGEGTYANGKQREGVVVRSTVNLLGHKPISFKVINLNYEN
jgi:RNA ligase (TIGR02306 family)